MLVFPLFSLENHREYFHSEISLIFLSKCPSVMGHTKGPSWEKISQWCFDTNSLVNWNICRFGKSPSHHFNPQFWEKFRGCFCMEISKRFLCSLQQMIHVDKTTCLSSSEFHRGYQESARVLVHFLPIVDIQWILPWFSPVFGDIKWMPPPNFPLLHLHASMIG